MAVFYNLKLRTKMARVSVRLDELLDRPEPLYNIDLFFDEETDRIAMARFKVIIQMDLLNVRN